MNQHLRVAISKYINAFKTYIYGKNEENVYLCAYKLLKEKKVVVVPGSAFGESGEGFIRISYAYSIEDLKKALARVEEFIQTLK